MTRTATERGHRGHIVMLTMYYRPEVGAPQARLEALTTELIAQGFTVEVVTAMPNYPTGRVFDGYRGRLWTTERDQAGLVIRRVRAYAAMGSGVARLLSYLSFTALCVFGLLRCRRPRLVFIESPPLFVAMPGIVAAKLWRATSVFNVADLWPDAAVELGALRPGLQLRAALRLEHWAYRHADVVTAVTNSLRRVLTEEKAVPADKLVDLPNGVDTTRFHPREQSGDDEFETTIVYAGTVGFIHAAETLLDAMALLSDTDVRLVFYASGSSLATIEERLRAASLGNVELRTPVPPAELAPVLRGCLAGVVTLADIPMAEKTRPSKMFPVMASARPVLYCGGGEGAELVRQHDAGVVVPNRAEEIAVAIRGLRSDPARCRELGANGRRFVVDELSWAAICSRWLEAIEPRLR